jgi:hypothetical protein
MTTKCERCHWTYPIRLLSAMKTSKGDTGEICGICALALKNEVHGTHDEHFNGQWAEHLRMEAISWRRRHPDMGPAPEAIS